MPKNNGNLALKGLDELLFSTEEQRQEEKREQVQQILIDELHPFTNHPFKVVDDEAIDPDADYTEDTGDFEIPPEDDSEDEDTSEEQDVTPI